MKTLLKYIIIFTISIILSLLIYDAYNKHLNYNFGEITQNKVYKSGVIEPSKLKDYIDKYKIKSVIDLRNDHDTFTNNTERMAIDKINGVKYYHIPSQQVPNEENLKVFFEILDNEENYPVKIHCYHGLGRTMLYVALYRIEYENWTNEDARDQTRPLYPVESFLHKSRFSKGTPKGDFLINYVPRKGRDAK